MSLSSIFAKQVDRPIEGVIKADDQESLALEIEEYVLTNEISKRLENFLDAYNNYQGANGVWISGFFGSGKSHLLKMLALVLENQTVGGQPALDQFIAKCGDNKILIADLRKAAAVPSKSILFNIDQKADVIAKTQIDALISVFVKVFDEMCGYFGKQGHIAQFERDLDSRGLYEKFKTAYQETAGQVWDRGREQALLEGDNVAKAYSQATGKDAESARGILDKYREEHKVSIEDFAKIIQAYVESQGKDFRLNFFVDEVGQYVADNVKLMTNLQTIAESLATKCQGRAWVIVTAQGDMDQVIGEMGTQRGNDFSKIQDRFSNRMKLTSTDVAEVIQQRLLLKNDNGIDALEKIYAEQHNNFKTLFNFTDGARTYRNFKDRDHFIHFYPFVPYQFELFQAAIQNLSAHNAFEGRHSSVGERSMLGVFQQVAIRIANHEVGQLATFDLMFEGISTALKTQVQSAIISAGKNLDNEFAVKLLKALFLVKHVKEFKATARNLTVLMLDRFDRDLAELTKDGEEALGLLEQQTYIQRNGEVYEYLTDDEKDVEQEIKNTEVENADVLHELANMVFDHVVKMKKIRFADNGQDYSFQRILDDKTHGKEHELAIHVISPMHDSVDNEETLRMQTMGKDELRVILGTDPRLVSDLYMYKKTEKYIRQNISTTQQTSIKQILTQKQTQNNERFNELRQRVDGLVGKAKMIISGSDVEVGGSDPVGRINTGFADLIKRTYPNLKMLRGREYKETEIAQFLKLGEGELFGDDEKSLSEPETEILGKIKITGSKGLRMVLKTLLADFNRKPYGWSDNATLCNLAKLCARGKVEVKSDSNILDNSELEQALRNTRGYGNIIIEPQVDFTQSQIRALKDFFEEFFDKPAQAGEAKALGQETGAAFTALVAELRVLVSQCEGYPFLDALQKVLDAANPLAGKPYTFYLVDLAGQLDDLLDLKEDVLDPIRGFLGGSQKDIFVEARSFLAEQDSNFAYVEDHKSAELEEIMADPLCYKGTAMQKAKDLMKDLKAKTGKQVLLERQTAREKIDGYKAQLAQMKSFKALPLGDQAQFLDECEASLQQLDDQKLIAVIRDNVRLFEETEFPKILQRISEHGKEEGDSGGGKDKPQVTYVVSGSVAVPFEKRILESEADVDGYVDALKEAYLSKINSNIHIQIKSN